MAKIILSLGQNVLCETRLLKDRVTIGRAPHNDLVIDDPAISAEHALITATPDGRFLKDLNSTNGTQINGQPVSMHFLQDRDLITLARYSILYHAEPVLHHPVSDKAAAAAAISQPRRTAVLRLKEQNGVIREIPLTKPLTTVGLPGSYVALIASEGKRYAVAKVEGSIQALLNGVPIGDKPEALSHGDVIKVQTSEMKFIFL